MSDDRHLRAWVERLSVIAIVGSVAALAVPKYASLERERVATQILTDVETLRKAVYAFYSDSAYFPAATGGEGAPESLIQYLPPSFAFSRPYGSLAYRNWTMASGPVPAIATDSAPAQAVVAVAPADTAIAGVDTAATAPVVMAASPATVPDSAVTRSPASAVPAANVVGVTVTVLDGRVGAMAASKMPPRTARFVVGNLYTFLFFGT